jgi:glycosyltransferase involved in cell wall biosynthesis
MKHSIFISLTPYPNGLASTNRMASLLNELPKHGTSVDVICMASTKFPTSFYNGHPRYDRFGTLNSVNYHYTSLTVKASSSFIPRVISGIWGVVTMPLLVISIWLKHRSVKLLIISNQTQVHYVVLIKIVSLIISSKLVLVRSEFPSLIRTKSKYTMLYKLFFEKWIFKLYDGFALMTNTLVDYFKPLSKKNAKFELIPMTVDINRFTGIHNSPFNFKYIAYAGSLSNEKDGLDILLKAFISIARIHLDIHLVIIGDTTKPVFYNKLLDLIKNDGSDFKNRIHFTGRIDASLIPKYLTNAFILALARPDSKQAQGGFPTKLGEYLATGKPVIVTKVGEIPNYLKDKKSAILCEPGCINDFTSKLDWALKNEITLKEIGETGKKVALGVFNSEVQGERFNNFLLKLIYV